jgi:acylphosphatase
LPSTSDLERVHVYIEGLVQGVFFRYHTQRLARELGVKGWVRNLPDGRVEAVMEGKREALERMLDFCRRGPPGAVVERVEVERGKAEGRFRDFEVRY